MTNRHVTPLAGARLEHRASPCTRCPWRKDVDLTAFSDADMEMLGRNNGRRGAEAPVSAAKVACHLDQPGTRHEYRLCAGWLVTVGADHLAVRVAVIIGALPASALTAGPEWPALYASLDDLLAARATQLAQRAAGGGVRAEIDGAVEKPVDAGAVRVGDPQVSGRAGGDPDEDPESFDSNSNSNSDTGGRVGLLSRTRSAADRQAQRDQQC